MRYSPCVAGPSSMAMRPASRAACFQLRCLRGSKMKSRPVQELSNPRRTETMRSNRCSVSERDRDFEGTELSHWSPIFGEGTDAILALASPEPAADHMGHGTGQFEEVVSSRRWREFHLPGHRRRATDCIGSPDENTPRPFVRQCEQQGSGRRTFFLTSRGRAPASDRVHH